MPADCNSCKPSMPRAASPCWASSRTSKIRWLRSPSSPRTTRSNFPCLKDAGNTLADAAGATRTPEVVVLGALASGKRPILYSGRIDDQFTYGKERPKAQHDYLGDALSAVLAGKAPALNHAEPVGCLIGKQLPPTGDQSVTYSNQISRILQKAASNAIALARSASLTSYEETVGWAEMIAEVTANNTMPPWHANPQHGKFRNDVRLSDEEKSLLLRWVEAALPRATKASFRSRGSSSRAAHRPARSGVAHGG